MAEAMKLNLRDNCNLTRRVRLLLGSGDTISGFVRCCFPFFILWDEGGWAEGAGAFVTCGNNYIRIKSFPLLT